MSLHVITKRPLFGNPVSLPVHVNTLERRLTKGIVVYMMSGKETSSKIPVTFKVFSINFVGVSVDENIWFLVQFYAINSGHLETNWL